MTHLNAPRLNLREFTPGDVDAMLGVFGDAEVMRFGKGVQTRDWVADWLTRQIMIYRQRPGQGLWGVVPQGTEFPIGYCGLSWFPDVGGSPETEIGYRLVRARWGQGYATEAARAVLQQAFESLGLERVVAIIDPASIASIRVAQKLGMALEKEVMFKNYSHADHLYVALAEPRHSVDTNGPGKS